MVVPLRADLDGLKEAIWAGEQARDELWRTCPGQDFVARLAEVGTKLRAAKNDAADMRKTMSD